MKKPSIFSKDYEKIMRKRRKRKIFCIIVLIFIILALIFVYFNYDYIHRVFVNRSFKTEVTDKKLLNEENQNKNLQKEEKKEEKKEEIITLKLKENFQIKVKINTENKENKKFEEIFSQTGFAYEFNKDKKEALIFIKESNEMFLINTEGIVENISYEIFITKDGTKIKRENKLKNEPDFIWTESPKLYNEKVVYLSKLPNLNNYNRYFLWIYNIKSKEYICIYDKKLRGKEMKIGKVSEKGLELTIDGKIKYINENGKINE